MSEILLAEKYRPKKLKDTILPKNIKTFAEDVLAKGDIANLLFYGSSGIGKTTLAKVLANELGYEVLYVNASDEGRSLDTVRTTIKEFAISTSLTGAKKVVILDEFCGCTSVVQDALKGFFEEYHKTCSFILTANNMHKINAPILSRFTKIKFQIPKDEEMELKIAFAKRVMSICDTEQIKTSREAVVALVKINFPDFRQILNHLQFYKNKKELTIDDVSALESPIDEIITALKMKNFKELVNIVNEMPVVDVVAINRELTQKCIFGDGVVKPTSKPMMIMLLKQYNVDSHFSQDAVVCILAEFVEIMGTVEFL